MYTGIHIPLVVHVNLDVFLAFNPNTWLHMPLGDVSSNLKQHKSAKPCIIISHPAWSFSGTPDRAFSDPHCGSNNP